MAQAIGTTTITRKPQNGESPVVYEIVPSRSIYYSDEVNFIPFTVYKVIGEKRELAHSDIEGGALVLESVNSGDLMYDEQEDYYYLTDSVNFVYGDNCGVRLLKDNIVVATFTWGFTKEGADGKQGATFSIRKWKDVGIGDRFRVESKENGVLISDIVIYEEIINGASVVSKWICKKAFTISATGTYTKEKTTPKEGSQYWNKFGNYFNVATDLVLADKAIIENLLLNNMSAYYKDADGTWDTENPTISIDGNTGEVTLSSVKYSKCFADVITSMNSTAGIVNFNKCYLLRRGYMALLNVSGIDAYFMPRGEQGQMITVVASTNGVNCHTILGNFICGNSNDTSEEYSQLTLGVGACVVLAKENHHHNSGLDGWTIVSEHGRVNKSKYQYGTKSVYGWYYDK